MCTHFLPCVMGRQSFPGGKYEHLAKIPLSNQVTTSDEAFTVIAYENGRDCWNDMLRTDRNNKKIKKELLRYSIGSGKEAKKYEGWTQEGIDRFLDIRDDIRKDRKGKRRKRFEYEFMDDMTKICQSLNDIKKKKKNKRLTIDMNDKEEMKRYKRLCLMDDENDI